MISIASDVAAYPVARSEKAGVSASVPSVTVRGVAKRFGSFAAVDDVSFSVTRGSFLSLLGPSGSGKTTILRMIAGFAQPSAGDILINDQAVTSMPPHKRSIGVVFQSLALFPHMSVAQNVAYPLKCRRFDRREIADRVNEYLKLVRLGGFENRRIDELSGGQRQRVAIARALVYRPDILLLDEPLAALDKKLREEIQSELRRIQSELRVTTINVTHDQREALVMSDEIIVLDGGRLQQRGAPSAIYERPANRFVATFIGHTNVVSGNVTAVDESSIALDVGGSEVRALRAAVARPTLGSALECALRAERIRIARCQEHLQDSDTRVPGRVVSVAYEGDRVIYEASVGTQQGAPVRIIQNDCLDTLKTGEQVFIGWNARDLIVLRPHGTA